MLLTLAEGLSSRGYDIDLLVVRKDGEKKGALPGDIKIIDLDAPRTLRAVPAIARYLRKFRPDALIASEHYSGLPALYALCLARTGTRCIIRQDNTWGMDSLRFKGRHRAITPWITGLLFRRAEIIAVSRGVEDDFLLHFPHLRKNVSMIYNPVVSEHLTFLGRKAPDHPWFNPGSPPVLVAVGRLQPAKGFDILIDAFSRVSGMTNARLLILGEGPDRDALQRRIEEHNLLGRCELIGYRENPYPYMAQSHAFVLSSRFEGLPTVLIEALAVGASVIATDCNNGPREILADGTFGTLIPVDDAEALANAIIASISNEVASKSELQEWLHQFEVESSLDAHDSFIRAAISSPPPKDRDSPLIFKGQISTSMKTYT